ncbi:nuclear transport factor 2 family protein [Streptomyces sp. NPDC058847]|uniref:nuclear transport factor 2 family protein n=1 Tax=Streptomyces sp. NPDC058847 TaxID=3346649 RepID=UPI00369BD5C2
MPTSIRVFFDATNSGDSESFVAAFTDDALLNDWGREYVGHGGIREWDHTDNIGVRSRLELLAFEPAREPDTYAVTLRVTGNGYNGTGSMVFRLRDGLIEDLRIG